MTERELATINLTVDLTPPATQQGVQAYVKTLVDALFEIQAAKLVLEQCLELAQEICDHSGDRSQGMTRGPEGPVYVERCKACRKECVVVRWG